MSTISSLKSHRGVQRAYKHSRSRWPSPSLKFLKLLCETRNLLFPVITNCCSYFHALSIILYKQAFATCFMFFFDHCRLAVWVPKQVVGKNIYSYSLSACHVLCSRASLRYRILYGSRFDNCIHRLIVTRRFDRMPLFWSWALRDEMSSMGPFPMLNENPIQNYCSLWCLHSVACCRFEQDLYTLFISS